MPSPAADITPTADSRLRAPRLWIAAAAEVGVAALVAAFLFGAGTTTSSDDPRSGMSGMHAHTHGPSIHWSAAILAVAATTTALFIWWAVTRERIPAALAAVGLVALATSDPVRAIALQSHLVAMAALEALAVAAPLLLISTWRQPRSATATERSVPWTVFVIVAVLLNSALLIGLHLPGVHTGNSELNAVPLWLAVLAVVIGLAYWGAILLTTGRVAGSVRRSVLIIGQEVAAILGLAAVIRPSPNMQHDTVFGLSSAADQRLGGVLMLITCAAVTLPLARRLQTPHKTDHLGAEHNVH